MKLIMIAMKKIIGIMIGFHFLFDGFLEIIPNNQTMQEFLDNEKYKKCQVIKVNWLLYFSNKEILTFENKSLKISFKNKLLIMS